MFAAYGDRLKRTWTDSGTTPNRRSQHWSLQFDVKVAMGCMQPSLLPCLIYYWS